TGDRRRGTPVWRRREGRRSGPGDHRPRLPPATPGGAVVTCHGQVSARSCRTVDRPLTVSPRLPGEGPGSGQVRSMRSEVSGAAVTDSARCYAVGGAAAMRRMTQFAGRVVAQA